MRKLLARVRPGLANSPVSLAVLIGWAARFGARPLVRGMIRFGWRRNFHAPIFVGKRVQVFYSSRLTLGQGVSIGDNCRINAFTVSGIVIGNRVTLRENGWVQGSSSPARPGESLFVGDDVYIGPNASLGVGGPIVIESGAQLGSYVTLVAENHDVSTHGGADIDVTRRGIKVGARSWLGHHVTILDGVHLGPDCVVGAGAVVTRSFPAGSKIGGVPARPLDQ